VSGSTLTVAAGAGESDNLVISRPSATSLRVADLPSAPYTGSVITAGAGCSQSAARQVTCAAAGIKLIQVAAGDQDDRVVNSTAFATSLDGGGEDDTLVGGSAADTLSGGPGVDALKGMAADDRLLARDGASDALVDCGAGSSDKADLDLVAKDPKPKVAGCETQTRSRLIAGPYIALGDSLADGFASSSPATKGYVPLLYSDYQTSLGAGRLANVGQTGATSDRLLNDGQLTSALGEIDAGSDTKAVTIDIGGNDLFLDPDACPGHWNQPGVCPFRQNFAEILGELKTALAHDPGIESFIAMAYYNPGGLTFPVSASKAQIDQALLGSNLSVGCTDTGARIGLNDIIYQEAGKRGIPVANPYPAFEKHSYISPSDPFHIHPGDAGYAEIARAFAHAGAQCEP
jgi:lysophospholipase L1-like esterase